MEFTEDTIGKIKIFYLKGKIMGDPASESMCEHLKQSIAAGMASLVMDFGRVRWINSHGIGMIIGCMTSLRNAGGDLRFANLQGATRHYFEITKLDTVIKIYDTVDEAVASFSKS